MRQYLTAILVSSTLLLVSAPSASLDTATFQPLGDLTGGEFLSRATSVSADGSTVVGHSESSFGTKPFEAFRWTESTGMVGLGGLASPPNTQARGVSADGTVVVLSASPWPLLWTESNGLTEIPDLTGTLFASAPFGLSADGLTVVGVGQEVSEPVNQAIRWTSTAGYERLGWLPSTIHDSFSTGASTDGSVLSGFSFHVGSDVEPTIWTAAHGMQTLGDVPGGDPYALGWDISDDGTTIVGDAHIGGNSEPWLWREDTGFVLPDPTHGATGGGWFEAVSADGSVAVGVPAIVWDADNGIRSLADVLTADGVDLTGWLLQSANDVSADGRTIVGHGINPGGHTEAWVIRLPLDPTSTRAGRETLALRVVGANPTSSLAFFELRLPEAGPVRAKVYSVHGRHVSTIIDTDLGEGTHPLQWNGHDDGGRRVASGSYFLRVDTRRASVFRKVTWID